MKKFFKNFFYESFRKRTKEDYKELTKPQNKTQVPWLYLRIFVIGFILFTIQLFAYNISGLYNEPYLTAIGSTFFSLAFLCIPYELNNNKEISIWELLLIVFISLSTVFFPILVASNIIITDVNLFVAIRAGVGEELIKAIYGIVIVAVLQKLNHKKYKPSTILLIGFAVGCGFGIAEDFGYIDSYNCNSVASTAFLRGFCSFGSHIAWTGLIVYAFYRFKKPLLNYRFWLVLIGAMTIHTIWDISSLPFMSQGLYNTIYYTILTIHWILAIAVSLQVVIKYNNKTEVIDSDGEMKKLPLPRVRHITGIITICIMLLFVYQYLYLEMDLYDEEEIENLEYYDTYENFKYRVQGNRNFNIDYERPYDNTMLDHYAVYEEGVLTSAQQIVQDGDVAYIYCYYLDEESNTIMLSEVRVYDGEKTYREDYLSPVDENDENIYPYFDMISETKIETWYSLDLIGISELDLEIDNGIVYEVNYEYKVILNYKAYLLIIGASLVLVAGGIIILIENKKYKKN